MGYDVHITRRQSWFDKDGPAISLDEWLAVVRSDPEMRLDGYAEAVTEDDQVVRVESDGLTVWTAYSEHGKNGNMAWFHLADGNVVVKNPDAEILRKMWEITQRVSAKVQGDDGEIYEKEGRADSGLTARLARKPWWKLW